MSWGVASYYLLFTKKSGAVCSAERTGVQAYLGLGSGTIVTSDFDARQGSLGLA